MIKAVLFDFDGVLVGSMSYHVKAWQIAFNEYNIHVKPNVVLLDEGSRSKELARKIFKDWNHDIPEEELKAFVSKKQKIYRKITKAKLLHGVKTFISFLKQQDIKIGLVTGSARLNVESTLPPYIAEKFDIIITGDDIHDGKPSPEAYLKAAHELNVEPNQCLVIENAPLGIQAAKNAGMKVVALTTTLDRGYLKEADFIARNLVELAAQWDYLWN